jgi:hypothetical protein
MPKTEIQFYDLFIPITSEPENAIRAAAHGDINLITLWGAKEKDYKFKTTMVTGLMRLLNQISY